MILVCIWGRSFKTIFWIHRRAAVPQKDDQNGIIVWKDSLKNILGTHKKTRIKQIVIEKKRKIPVLCVSCLFKTWWKIGSWFWQLVETLLQEQTWNWFCRQLGLGDAILNSHLRTFQEIWNCEAKNCVIFSFLRKGWFWTKLFETAAKERKKDLKKTYVKVDGKIQFHFLLD